MLDFLVGGIAKGGRCCLPFARTGNKCRPAERAPSGDGLDLEQVECHFYTSFLDRSPQTCRASRAAASTSLLALDSTASAV